MFILCLLITCVIHTNAYEKNGIRNVKDYILDTGLHKALIERRIFNLKRNGIKIDIKVVPSAKNDTKNKTNDYFPEFPVKDIETVSRLDEITLLGQDVKLVKSRAARKSDSRSMNNSDVSIEHSVDDFFDSFTLRITLPRWNNRRENNQIDVALDETIVEGRGKGGGGGGCGGKGGKCKMMMMGMLMMVKMKLIGLAAMKSMMMGGMSLMLSMMMLMNKFGKGGGGGGPWQGGGGGQLKEIVLLTKSSGGGGGGVSDSYGAPPPSSYGLPSGGGGYNSGGGWGRSFHKQPMALSYDQVIKAETANGSNRFPMIEATSNAASIDYPDYQDYQEPLSIINSSSANSNWKARDYIHAFDKSKYINATALLRKYSEEDSKVNGEESFIYNGNIVDVIEKNVNSMTSIKNQSDITYDTNAAYMDEWQATDAKISSNNLSLTNLNIIGNADQTKPINVPLLREI